MKFIKNWTPITVPSGETIYRPTLAVFVEGVIGFSAHDFMIDSGADLSMAPYSLFRELGRAEWEKGARLLVRGISPKEECMVEGRVHDVNFFIAELGLQIDIPVCFAKGDVPLLLGREGFFDHFIFLPLVLRDYS